MKTEYKYICFKLGNSDGGVSEHFWTCRNKNSEYVADELGIVTWYDHWRKWVFQPNTDIETIFNRQCLLDIADFIGQLEK